MTMTMNEFDEMQQRITELEVKLCIERKRADSMKLALDSAQNIASLLSRDIEAARVATETLDSERAANDVLTKRVEELEAELLRRDCKCCGDNQNLKELYVEALEELLVYAPAATSTSRWVEEELKKWGKR